MGDDADDSGGDRELSSSLSPNGKGSKNKRKFLSEFLPDKIDMSSLTEFPRYELLEEKLRRTSNEVGLLEGSDTAYEEQEVDEWADPLVAQFQALLSTNLLQAFSRAIDKIVERGYSKEVAEQTLLRCGLYHNSKDIVLNAMEGALIFMSREKELETSRCDVFSDFDNLVSYTIVEMVNVLKEVRPGITILEAMWFLLICDGNLLHACVVNKDHLDSFCPQELFGEASIDAVSSQLKAEAPKTIHPSLNQVHFSKAVSFSAQSSHSGDPAVRTLTQLSNPSDSQVHEVAITRKESLVPVPESVGKSTGSIKEHIQNVTQVGDREEKSGGCRKGSSGSSKREMLRQKAFHLEKSYKGRPKGGSLKAKVTWSSMGFDKPLKLPSGSSSIAMKSTFSKTIPTVGAKSPLPEDNYNVSNISRSISQATDTNGMLTSTGTVSALPAVNTEDALSSTLESEPTLETSSDNSGSSEVPDYCAGIPYDESLGKYVPQDDKDETILSLTSHMKELEREIKGWNEWANEKVMQATQRLSKDQMELKVLKQEREEAEKFKKDKQNTDDTNLKRLLEMEYAISNATKEIDIANSTIRSLDKENSLLKVQLEAAKQRAFAITKNLEEASLKEQEALKRSQAMDKVKVSLQEELTSLRRRASDLQHQLERAHDRKKQLEALWKQEEREKQKYLLQAEDLRKETEQRKAKTKGEEDSMRETAEGYSQKFNQHLKKLKDEISQLRLVSESSKIAALLGSVDVNYDRSLIGSKLASACWESQVPKIDKRLTVSQDNFEEDGINPERECVMCLTEEISVVFFPCGHEVLCRDCNVLHEKQGMNDCPSCRTPIQERIYVRFEESQRS